MHLLLNRKSSRRFHYLMGRCQVFAGLQATVSKQMGHDKEATSSSRTDPRDFQARRDSNRVLEDHLGPETLEMRLLHR